MPAIPPVVLVAGSLHHDIMIEADHLPRRDETAVGTRWYPKFGGKGGNQAIAAQRAGGAARMFGAVGVDAFGAFLTDALSAASVDLRFVRQIAGTGSGMSVAIQDRAGDYAATIVSGANLHLRADDLMDAALWQDVEILILQNEIMESVNLAAAAAARARGVKVLLNAAPARAVSRHLRACVDILVVNAVEAEMMGTPPVTDLATAAHAARELAAQFDSVIVTAGGAGLAVWTHLDERFTIPAQNVVVASTHGAGDMFVGTLGAHLAKGDGFETACRAASIAAALHVAGKG